MRVLLISSNTERINMVTIPLGLGLVGGAARSAGHDVAFLDLLGKPDTAGAIAHAVADSTPDVIGISVRNIDDQNREAPRFLLEQVRPVVLACRAATTAPIVLGGAGYSIFPDAALEYLGADFGISGDGEAAFTALLACLRDGGDPGLLPGVRAAGRLPGPGPSFSLDLDAFPAWDPVLTPIADPSLPDLWVPIQTRRGCPNDCSYCSTASIQGRKIRGRSPRRVVEQIAQLALGGCRRFYFVDNSFNIPESQAIEICRWMTQLAPGTTWRCIIYPHRVSVKLVEAIARAGCVEVALGFESGSAPVLHEMNKRFTPADVRATADLLAAHGIRRHGFLLLGGPGETRVTVEESLAFAASLRLDFLKITVGIRIYANTPLARRALEDGVIGPADNLLYPRFYLARGLEPWLRERVSRFVAEHPNLG